MYAIVSLAITFMCECHQRLSPHQQRPIIIHHKPHTRAHQTHETPARSLFVTFYKDQFVLQRNFHFPISSKSILTDFCCRLHRVPAIWFEAKGAREEKGRVKNCDYEAETLDHGCVKPENPRVLDLSSSSLITLIPQINFVYLLHQTTLLHSDKNYEIPRNWGI